jgi:cytochrome c-type biogenesis protein CcmH
MAEQEVSVYRDQLQEVDRDLERGVIAPAEAEAARTEIARRLIRADADGRGAPALGAAQAPRRASALAAVVVMPVLAVGLYVALGSPDMPDAPLAARLSAPADEQDMAVLLARVEQHLAGNPDDLRGWQVVAPVYLRLGQLDAAVVAFGNIARLAGSNVETEGDLGETIVRANGGQVTGDAQAAFARALADDPKDIRARFYMALADSQAGRRVEAAAALGAILDEAPPGATWADGIRQVLAELDAPAPEARPGPSAEDVAAAEGMSAGDRSTMIEGMVSQLAERLQAEPNDAEGWARLVRSYMVLGRQDEARAALEDARSALSGATDKLALVESEARATGLIQ